MVLNYIWIAFFAIAFLVALGETLFDGNLAIWSQIMEASFTSAEQAFKISIGLTGILSLWMGLMKIGERGGVIQFFGRLISPLFSRLFPGIPKGHPAMGSIFMNVSANMLGLDNAATPLGLKAMQELQSLNDKKDTATDAMLMFLVLNASGLCLIPIGVMMYRSQCGAANPTDVFIPIMIATFLATLVGIIALCLKQRINILDRVIISWIGGLTLFIGSVIGYLSTLPEEKVAEYSSFAANFLLFSLIIGFLAAGFRKKVNMYDSFIEGAKEGFKTAVMIIPYLVAVLVAIGMFRASGAMGVITDWITSAVSALGIDAEWVGALPTALMKPLSGSGSRGMMVDVMNTYGADAFVSRVASCLQGSTDTTFYILAVYFGSVGVKKTRYAVPFALLADVVGSVSAILVAYFFFG
ncbi:MAG: nucleoside recognition domain-containing protein [Bacteroidales bacterium]|nr:nucleoside recognition domain-containing protein [Bacteroidales bacterium]